MPAEGPVREEERGEGLAPAAAQVVGALLEGVPAAAPIQWESGRMAPEIPRRAREPTRYHRNPPIPDRRIPLRLRLPRARRRVPG